MTLAAGKKLLQAASAKQFNQNIRLASVFVQKPAPDFSAQAVVGKDFKQVKLSDYKGKYVVLFFYPLDLYVFVLEKLPIKLTFCY